MGRVNKRRFSYSRYIALGIAAMMLAVAGCGSSDSESAGSGDVKMAMISQNPESDPFARLAYSGLERLEKKDGVKPRLSANVQPGAFEQQIRAAAQQGNRAVYVLYDDLAKAAIRVAPDFPKTDFILVDTQIGSKLENVENVVIDPTASAYLAGTVAAGASKTGKLGFVGGADVPQIKQYRCGFAAGIKSVDAGDKLSSVYAGTFIDPNKGGELAQSLYGEQVDVIMHAAALTGLGVLKEAGKQNKLGIGVDTWQGDVAPGHVPWSAIKDVATAVENTGRSVVDGSFKGGEYNWDAKAGAKLFDQRDLDKLSAKEQDALTRTAAKLKSGEIALGC